MNLKITIPETWQSVPFETWFARIKLNQKYKSTEN